MARVPTCTAAAVVTIMLALAGCGDDDATPAAATTTTIDATTTTAGTTSTVASDLPGEAVDIFPYADAELGVVGVAADEVLNVRAGPGTGFEIVAELQPTAGEIIATGRNRSLGAEGFWNEVEVRGHTGWANAAFLAQLGRIDDITTEIAPTPADRPSAETMLDLGRTVAARRASAEPPSDIVVVDGPTVGDLGEITVDVIGLGDDAVTGERLHIFGEPDPGGERFTMQTVERTLLCTRGVDGDLCV